ERELPDVRFKDRLGGTNRPVLRYRLTATLAGHSVNTASRVHQLAGDDIPYPIDQAVAHNVAGHFDLPLRRGFVLADQRLQRAERQGVQQNAHRARRFLKYAGDVRQDLAARLLVSRILVEKNGVASVRANPLQHLVRVRKRLAAVQMYAEN